MVRARGSRAAVSLGLVAGTVMFRNTVFVPPPSVGSVQAKQASLAACAATVLGASGSAHADAIGDAAAKLSKAAYPFMKEVPWNSGLYNINPGSADAISWTKAIGKMIAMGAQMDSKLLAAGGEAHHKAMQGLPSNGVCSEAQLTAINAAIGRMIASVPESTTMGVYNSVKDLVDPKVPAYLMSTVKEADAKAAYNALIEFTSVVKSNPITPTTPALAHAKAIENMDAKGVLTQADFEAINTGLGKSIASAGTAATMDVYNAMLKLAGSSPVPNYLFSKVNPQDAIAAYNGLMEFKDVVKAAQR